MAVDIVAKVAYQRDGTHFAMMDLKSKDDNGASLKFSLTVAAAFVFDLAVAKASYTGPVEKLPGIIAANISRILYAGGREMVAMITARSPSGSAMLDSVLIEPADVSIESVDSYDVIMKEVFDYTKPDTPMQTNKIVNKTLSRTSKRKSI